MNKHARSLRLAVLAIALLAAAVTIFSACSAEDAEASASDNAAQNYFSWTKADWDSADDAQKTDAAKAVVQNLEQSLLAAYGGESSASASTSDGELLNETAEQMVEDIDAYFQENSDRTLQDLVDDTLNLLGVN